MILGENRFESLNSFEIQYADRLFRDLTLGGKNALKCRPAFLSAINRNSRQIREMRGLAKMPAKNGEHARVQIFRVLLAKPLTLNINNVSRTPATVSTGGSNVEGAPKFNPKSAQQKSVHFLPNRSVNAQPRTITTSTNSAAKSYSTKKRPVTPIPCVVKRPVTPHRLSIATDVPEWLVVKRLLDEGVKSFSTHLEMEDGIAMKVAISLNRQLSICDT